MEKILSNTKFLMALCILLTIVLLYVFSEESVQKDSFTSTFMQPQEKIQEKTFAIIRALEFIENMPVGRRKSKEYYISTIVYEANKLIFTEDYEIDKELIAQYKIGDSLVILYSINEPSNFEILGSNNVNYNLEREKYWELMKKK